MSFWNIFKRFKTTPVAKESLTLRMGDKKYTTVPEVTDKRHLKVKTKESSNFLILSSYMSPDLSGSAMEITKVNWFYNVKCLKTNKTFNIPKEVAQELFVDI